MSDFVQKIRVRQVDEPRVRVRVLPRVPPLEIELQNTGTEIQWRVGTTGTWQTLVEIDDIDASVSIGTVTTLAPGASATVANVGTAQNVILDFGIPAGFDGQVVDITAGQGIAVDSTDPAHPIVTVDAVASEIPFTPTGGLAATNVQTALAELDTEKQAAGSYQPLDADLTAIAALVDPNADRVLFWDDSLGAYAYLSLAPGLVISGTELRSLEVWGVALSDETTSITTGTGKASFSIPYEFKVVGVYATLNTVSSSGTPTFDVNEGLSSILGTKIVIDVSELTGGSAGYQGTGAAATITDDTIAAFAQITWDIDTAGTGAKGAKGYLVGYRNS